MAIHEGRCTLGNWEKISIENALMMFDRGLYSAAMHEVACALWPKDNRSPNLKISARTASRTLDEFDRELERLMQRPD